MFFKFHQKVRKFLPQWTGKLVQDNKKFDIPRFQSIGPRKKVGDIEKLMVVTSRNIESDLFFGCKIFFFIFLQYKRLVFYNFCV